MIACFYIAFIPRFSGSFDEINFATEDLQKISNVYIFNPIIILREFFLQKLDN